MLKFVAMTLEFYDILQGIISGVDYPGLNYGGAFLIPLAIAANAGLQAWSASRRKNEAETAETRAANQARESRRQFDEYSEKLRKLASEERILGQEAYDLASTRRNLAETTGQDLKDSLNRIEGAAVRGFGGQTGTRGAGVNELLQNLGQQRLQVGSQIAEDKLAADADLTAQELAMDDANFQRKFDMEQFLLGQQQQLAIGDRDRALAQGETAVQEQALADQAMFDAFGNAAASLVGAYGPSGASAKTAAELGLTSISEDGGLIPKGKAGMAIKTPGEFSHATNPLAVFQGEQGMTIKDKMGEEVAEFTGEEVVVEDETETLVFNPDQQVSMQELIDEGDEKGLFKYIKELLAKFEKDAKAHEEMKEQNV